MKRVTTLIVALGVGLIGPAQAAECHRYSYWHYPWRQSCYQKDIHKRLMLARAFYTPKQSQPIRVASRTVVKPPEPPRVSTPTGPDAIKPLDFRLDAAAAIPAPLMLRK